MNSLDLYAKIEPMIGFYQTYEELYDIYEELIKKFKPKTMLDVGCGNGNFLKRFKHIESEGIDISPQMVQICKAKGLNAYCKKVEEVQKRYDVVVAVADVLNYLDDKSLKNFLDGVEKSLNKNGYFLCDINTIFGFEEIACGVMASEDEKGFLSIEADFLDDELVTDFTFFEKQNECYKKFQWRIRQFYHKISKIEKLSSLRLINKVYINLFDDKEADKVLLIFQVTSS